MKEYGNMKSHFDQMKNHIMIIEENIHLICHISFNKIFDIDIKSQVDQYINLEDYKFKMNKDDGYIKNNKKSHLWEFVSRSYVYRHTPYYLKRQIIWSIFMGFFPIKDWLISVNLLY